MLLRQGAVTSFVPNPDHIHVTGVPPERPRAVSLHLYGRSMSNFNIYDVKRAHAVASRSRTTKAEPDSSTRGVTLWRKLQHAKTE